MAGGNSSGAPGEVGFTGERGLVSDVAGLHGKPLLPGGSTGGGVALAILAILGKFNHNQTLRPNPGIMVNKGNHPQMALSQVSEIF